MIYCRAGGFEGQHPLRGGKTDGKLRIHIELVTGSGLHRTSGSGADQVVPFCRDISVTVSPHVTARVICQDAVLHACISLDIQAASHPGAVESDRIVIAKQEAVGVHAAAIELATLLLIVLFSSVSWLA